MLLQPFLQLMQTLSWLLMTPQLVEQQFLLMLLLFLLLVLLLMLVPQFSRRHQRKHPESDENLRRL